MPDLYPALLTERLCLRAPRYSDAADVFAFCSDPASCTYADWYPHVAKRDTYQYIAWLKKQTKRSGQGYTWFVELKKERKIIATLSIVELDYSGSIATIGYTLSRDYQHQGYATEMVTALLRYLFFEAGAVRVQAKVMPENVPSIRLLERVGMQKEALLACGAYCKNGCVDVYLYAVLKETYKKMKAGRPTAEYPPAHPAY